MKQQREMSGVLSKYEGSSDKSPNYKGTCTIDGKTFSISGWIKQGSNGPFLSLAFDEPKARHVSHSDIAAGEDIGFEYRHQPMPTQRQAN